MTFDLQRIWDSKRAYRRRLAAMPCAEKLRMLDALRERALAIRAKPRIVKETPDEYRLWKKT